MAKDLASNLTEKEMTLFATKIVVVSLFLLVALTVFALLTLRMDVDTGQGCGTVVLLLMAWLVWALASLVYVVWHITHN